MPKTVVVAVRVPEDVKKQIEELGFNIQTLVKETIEEKLKRRKSEQTLRWIKVNRVPGKTIGFNSVKTIRQMRKTM